jgi:hypothetical protein
MTKKIETKSLVCPNGPAEAKAIIVCGTAWSYGQAYTHGWRAVVGKPYTYRCAACVPDEDNSCRNCKHTPASGSCSICDPQKLDQWEPINQCDGCRRRLPIKNGIHKGDGDYDMIACTKARYL